VSRAKSSGHGPGKPRRARPHPARVAEAALAPLPPGLALVRRGRSHAPPSPVAGRTPPAGTAPPPAKAPRAGGVPGSDTTMPAGLFKARCLELMDRVQAEGSEIVITKYGHPVAKLVPASPGAAQGFGALRGTVKSYGDLVSPVDEPWEADRD